VLPEQTSCETGWVTITGIVLTVMMAGDDVPPPSVGLKAVIDFVAATLISAARIVARQKLQKHIVVRFTPST
ncbi:MAG: hypothetical protein IPN61_14395, partial [Bacteroidetes bacterium]|nr:hypothetical protein [Bacteroidota bacterium]